MTRPLSTDERYARCLVRGHRYGSEMVWREYQGHRLELRVCAYCRVPEKPRLNATMGVMKGRSIYEALSSTRVV